MVLASHKIQVRRTRSCELTLCGELPFIAHSTIESKIADGDALLVLENLKLKGYRNGNLHVGFNKFDSLKILEVSDRAAHIT